MPLGPSSLGEVRAAVAPASGHPEHLVGAGVGDIALGSEEHSGIGHVDRSVRSHRGAIEEPGLALGADVGDQRPGALVEGAGEVDVRHPQRVAADGQSLGRIQGDALLPALDELDRVRGSVRPEPADVSVVVLLGGVPLMLATNQTSRSRS